MSFFVGGDITDIDVGVDVDEVCDEVVFSFGLEEVELDLAVQDREVHFEFYDLGELGILPWFFYQSVAVILEDREDAVEGAEGYVVATLVFHWLDGGCQLEVANMANCSVWV